MREREEIFHKSLKEDLQETKESLESFKETIAQEIKTSQMKMEYNLKKEMQELQERMKMDIDERERKLQKSIDQVQGDMEKVEGELTKKIEVDIEETKAELGERINEVETNCNHRIAKVTQMQKQCNEVVKGIGDRQNQLAVNLRNAIAVQREEDNKRVQQLESKTEEIDKRISNATLAIRGGKVVTLMSSDNRCIQSNTGQKFRPKGGLHPMIFMKWLKGVLPAHLKDSDKIQFAIDRMEGEAFTWGVRKKEGTTSYDQFEEEFLKKYCSKSHQCAAIEDLLHCKSLSTWRGALREFAEHLWELNETLEQPLSDDVMISAIKRRMSQRMQETISGSLIEDREALMKILEQLESVRAQGHNQPNDQNRGGGNDPRNHFGNSYNYRGRGGSHRYRNQGGERQWRNDWRRNEEPRDHERRWDRRMNDTVHIEEEERPEN
ncbi:uncharacterized protein LOC126249249 [Schistocerca nitens]|uniref:uncharacterized protein LOC126249249 n=1 Tax=Schistocerca nitens TaxID=7011 RepID=UPI002118C4FC|nr:uncharacterized protein LOC126249249 [Schistocerca nitens]